MGLFFPALRVEQAHFSPLTTCLTTCGDFCTICCLKSTKSFCDITFQFDSKCVFFASYMFVCWKLPDTMSRTKLYLIFARTADTAAHFLLQGGWHLQLLFLNNSQIGLSVYYWTQDISTSGFHGNWSLLWPSLWWCHAIRMLSHITVFLGVQLLRSKCSFFAVKAFILCGLTVHSYAEYSSGSSYVSPGNKHCKRHRSFPFHHQYLKSNKPLLSLYPL